MPSRSTIRALGAASVTGLGAAALLTLLSPAANAAPTTVTFEFTGTVEEFVVPAGVCRVTVFTAGAEGGPGDGDIIGGLGGTATGTIEVTPGETLEVRVGGQGLPGIGGEKGSPPAGADAEHAAAEGSGGFGGDGGYNGGGDGGGGDEMQDGAGGGGGASDVRQGGSGLNNRVVVGGGGGGGGGDFNEGGSGGEGGDGGGSTGVTGNDSQGGASGGTGGTPSAGGIGGPEDSTAGDGTSGQGGIGGIGNFGNDAGGGGGGGFFGGGGGAGDTGVDSSPPAEAASEGAQESTDNGGGGGGGSGFGPEGVAFETGARAGDGLVTITYDPADGGCEPDVLPDDTVPPVVAGQPAFTG